MGIGKRKELLLFGLALGFLVGAFLHESLFLGKVLSPADVLLVERTFHAEGDAGDYEPQNRLLMDPVLQFQPWLEFNRAMIRRGRIPLWNPYAGCGAPHLANGQSAVFDPINALAYAATVPVALGWMAAIRLWLAGLGAFLLARFWGMSPWGRWFAGLVYPFCGFLVVWLLYPVTPVAIWLPWMVLASDRAIEDPRPRSAGLLAIVVALAILGGHIQTAAHVLLAALAFAVWRLGASVPSWSERTRRMIAWSAGIGLGTLLASVQVIPLAGYLSRSSVWGDRRQEMKPWWAFAKPRVLDSACMAFPYAYGSQRRGQPNLARAVGVQNLNESAGSYAGLATLLWLAPLGLRRRGWAGEAGFLAALAAFGAMAAYRLPPVDNLLRMLPVLDVTDNRRMALWAAFGLVMLGAAGIEALAQGGRIARWWIGCWLVAAAALAIAAAAIPRAEGIFRDRAERHALEAAERGLADGRVAQDRAGRQVAAAMRFLPRYYGLCALELAALAGIALAARRGPPRRSWPAACVLGLTLAEMAAFGLGLNPAIDPEIQRREPPAIARLRELLPPGARALGIGEELPPNALMRFGLADPRNYDSVELASSLGWLAPLYEPSDESLSSRRTITWGGVARARARLEAACVAAVVGAERPPPGAFPGAERAGGVWIARLDAAPWASPAGASAAREPGRCLIRIDARGDETVIVREAWDPGWRAFVDGRPAPASPHEGAFLSVACPKGTHTITLEYLPIEWPLGCFGSLLGAAGAILALTGRPRF
ncbi:Bacterial membrane protein YfhO [Aquisphaera giovannonii]|uniref:Bacterial membrane protein YfhO n=1 Tax=Aquisphaera giovannonii TaxID=406548 RepID=A0A5B9WB99_9BACT|nr:YfhO family protein [Aquisphaera giovannonii]QEH37315.1 Bacterial membrane protein YfhO [Aquisphaera giovannonii]